VILLACALLPAATQAATSINDFAFVDVAGACRPAVGTPSIERGMDADNVEAVSKLIVGPPLIDVRAPLAAGDRFTCTITVRNRRAVATTLDLRTSGVVGARAGVGFLDANDPDAATTAASWLRPAAPSVTLAPREFARVPVTVTVPEDPPVGSAYAALLFVPRASDEDGNDVGPSVGVVSRIAVPFLLRVGGEGQAKLHLRDARAPRVRWDRDPWTWRADLDNNGTLHTVPSGRVRIRSLFGSTVRELPIAGRALLPEGRVPLEVTWRGLPWFGIYRYDARVGDAQDPKLAPARASGWILVLPPWWVLALAGFVLVLAIVGLVTRRRQWDDHEDDTDGFETEDRDDTLVA